MKDRYAYYPGCLASLSQKELDSSSRAIMGLLGAELVEMPSVTCCGAGDIHEAKPDYYLHISARILGQAERSGCDTILTICNVCTLNLRQANERLKENPAELARINDNLKQTGIGGYEGGVDVRHLLWEVSQGDGYERFKQVAVKSLEGLKVAPFYGCQILRPAKLLGFDDPDRPTSLERLIEACGAEAIDYPAKIKCCGFMISSNQIQMPLVLFTSKFLIAAANSLVIALCCRILKTASNRIFWYSSNCSKVMCSSGVLIFFQ